MEPSQRRKVLLWLLLIPVLLAVATVWLSSLQQPDPDRPLALFGSYDSYLQTQIASFSGQGLGPRASLGELAQARVRVQKGLSEALSVPLADPPATGVKAWSKETPSARIEAWRISTPGEPDLPALLYWPRTHKVSAIAVIAPGTGQNKHDFLSQTICAQFVEGGMGCLAFDPLGEGERSATPLARAREMTKDDILLRSVDAGRPYLGTLALDIRRAFSFLDSLPAALKIPRILTGYSLGGWSTLLASVLDDRPSMGMASSTFVYPPEVSGNRGGGWRIPHIFRTARLSEIIALAASRMPLLWVNGGADSSFIDDPASRKILFDTLAGQAGDILGDMRASLIAALMPNGPHLPYFATASGRIFLRTFGYFPNLPDLLPRPLMEDIAAIARTTDPSKWPRHFFEYPWASAHSPLLPASDLFVGGEPFETLPQWLAREERRARGDFILPKDASAARVFLEEKLCFHFASLVQAGRWDNNSRTSFTDAWTGLRARVEKGGGTGLGVVLERRGWRGEDPAPPGFKTPLALVLHFEVLPYSDNEPAADTTATGETLAAVLSLLRRDPFDKFERYTVSTNAKGLGLLLQTLDRPRAREVLESGSLLAPTALAEFHREGHIPGITGIVDLEALAALAPAVKPAP